jgi:hypothetical protein
MKKLLLFTLLLSSCASRYILKDDLPQTVDQVEDYILVKGLKFGNVAEEAIIRKSLYYLFTYLEQRFGEKDFGVFYYRTLHGESIPDAMRETYGAAQYAIAYESFLLVESPHVSDIRMMKSTNDGVFLVYYFPGSQAEKDLSLIFYQLDYYFTKLTNVFIKSAHDLHLFQTNLSLFNDGAIHVFLFENRAQGGIFSVGEGYIGFSYDLDKNSFIPEIGFKTAYYNALSGYVFSHELTLLIMGLTRMDPPIRPIPYPEKFEKADIYKNTGKLMTFIQSVYSTNAYKYEIIMGKSWGEGIAEYMTSRFNFLIRYGIIGDVDDDLRYITGHGGNLTPVSMLLDNGLRFGADMSRVVMHYQEMHSAVAYITAKYGWDAMLRLIDLPGSDEDFLSVLGLDRGGFNKAWKSAILH